MKSIDQILQETITRYGLTAWEAHSDKMNKMIAKEAMESYHSQFRITDEEIFDAGCRHPNSFDPPKVMAFVAGANWVMDKIFKTEIPNP